MDDVDAIVAKALADFGAAGDPAALEDAKARYLGRSGVLTELRKTLGALAPEARKQAGASFNQAKDRIEQGLEARRAALADSRLEAQLAGEALDVTLPGRGRGRGGIHPVIRTWRCVVSIFGS
ncbi:MAG: phenylalanine--tRNA ligase subunit alpha, partial [Proteobacteria bacterium]|nr:phenylalanine--tRNA ligase subunit alpha [Pseudomonadota bacterium]